jgi:hypothetical protein
VSVIPIAQYLARFVSQGEPPAEGPRRQEAASLRSLDPRHAEDQARKLEDAAARGREEGRAQAAAAFEIDLAHERAQLEARIAAARGTWVAEEGQRLGAAVATGLEQLQAEIAGSVARILKPFLAGEVREQVLASLSETMTGLVSSTSALLKVSGPEDLLDALRERFGPTEASVVYEVAAGIEVSVVADHTVVESRLQAWIDRLDRATD